MHGALARIKARVCAGAALLSLVTAPPAAAGASDAALAVTAMVPDRCSVGAQVDIASGEAVQLSLHCQHHTDCAAGFGPLDEPQPMETARGERCRFELRLRASPVITRTPHLFQVDF